VFYLLKHFLLLILVIFKLKCNNLIFNKIILNDSYVCFRHSRFIENHPIWILEDRPHISEVVLSHCLLCFVAPGGVYHSKKSMTRGYTGFFNLSYVSSSHLGVLDYEAQIGLSLPWVPHFHVRCEASLSVVLPNTSFASNSQELSQGFND
jgi:hypothetical protein